jgi:hypothetical protein
VTEREEPPYWQEDIALGEGRFYRGEPYGIRMRLHTTTERYGGRDELVPLTHPGGERVYVHGKPYILVPDITLTIGLYERPEDAGAVGEVTDAEWSGMRHEDIGQAQAWYYPADRLIVLWECYADDRHRGEDPARDETLTTLWTGFEDWLSDRFPEAARIVTTWEDIFDRQQWQAFLTSRGYAQESPAAFGKPADTSLD